MIVFVEALFYHPSFAFISNSCETPNKQCCNISFMEWRWRRFRHIHQGLNYVYFQCFLLNFAFWESAWYMFLKFFLFCNMKKKPGGAVVIVLRCHATGPRSDPGAGGLERSYRNHLGSGICPMWRHFPWMFLYTLARVYRSCFSIGKS